MPLASSTRWCPTPEQLMILEEMYRNGVRTPNASHIQQITAHLSYYGKIEGKNVFYWFQNHKARDRQKLRRKLSRQHQLLHQHPHALQYFPQLQQQTQPHLLDHQAYIVREETHGMNSVCKLETSGGRRDEAPPAMSGSTANGYEWMVMTDVVVGSAFPPCCRPLKTLDLFPTRSTGLKDESCTSKSSSCSTSTN